MHDKITVLIPCKDEEDNIRACVESARLVADEILIADSGSTDRTMEIVVEMGGCRLIEREFIGYANFKNWAIPQASHAWVLIVDADERVTPELADEIRKTLSRPAEKIDAYWIRRRNFFLGHEIRHGGWNTDDVCRLIRRDRCRYGERPIHEEIEIDPWRAGRLRSKLDHYTVWSFDDYFDKHVKYTRLSAEHAWNQGHRAGYLSLLGRPFLRFFHLYILRRGFLDGRAGLQVCMLTAFFNTYVRQARLWALEHGKQRPREPGIPQLRPVHVDADSQSAVLSGRTRSAPPQRARELVAKSA